VSAEGTTSLYRTGFLSVILFVAVLLTYLWGHIQTMSQGEILAQLRTERKTLFHERDRLQAQISGLKQSTRIRHIAENKLDMVFPSDPPRNLYLESQTK
jgi:cell division protein FtsL